MGKRDHVINIKCVHLIVILLRSSICCILIEEYSILFILFVLYSYINVLVYFKSFILLSILLITSCCLRLCPRGNNVRYLSVKVASKSVQPHQILVLDFMHFTTSPAGWRSTNIISKLTSLFQFVQLIRIVCAVWKQNQLVIYRTVAKQISVTLSCYKRNNCPGWFLYTRKRFYPNIASIKTQLRERTVNSY